MDKRVLTNYDHPLAFDMDLLIEHLDLLKRRGKVFKNRLMILNSIIVAK